MTLVLSIAGALTVLLLVYLGFALLFPEKL